MRIALVGDLSGIGPADRVGGGLYGIADFARALARRGHEVSVHTAASRAADESAEGFTLDRIPVRATGLGSSAELMPAIGEMARHLTARWSQDTPDVVHCHGWVYGMAAQLAAKKCPAPTVQTFHGLSTSARRHRSAGDVSETAVKLESLLARNAAAVTAACRDDLKELIRLGCPRAKVSVLAPGIQVSDTHGGDIVSRLGEEKVRIVAVAHDLAPPQGLADVVTALKSLADAELIVVAEDGTGPGARRIEETAQQLGVGGRVRQVVGCEPHELTAELRSADIVVLPARYQPNSDLALQAMACGAPIVAFAAGGARDAVIEDVTGLLVAPGDAAAFRRALRSLLAQPVLRQGMGLAGRSRARSRYSWDRIATDAETVYASAGARHRRQDLAETPGPGMRGSLGPQSCSPVTRK